MTMDLTVDIEKRFASGTTIRGAFRATANGNNVTVLFGPSGCGKTTVLRCLAGLERPETGRIAWGEEIWFDAARSVFMTPQRRGVGYLFQDYALFPHLTVAGNVAFGLRDRKSPAARRIVAEVLDLLQIADLVDSYPGQLSGGQQQRVALARSIVCRPRLLLLDEPLSALDAPVREQLRSELRNLLVQLGLPAIVVTHDRVEALALADHVVVFVDGQVRQTGPVQDVFNRPDELSIARVVGIETVLPGEILDASDGLATVQVGSVRLTALAPAGRERKVFVCIRGEDVIVLRGHAGDTSARNQLAARITSRSAEGPLVRLGLDCGVSLTALVTRPSAHDLHLDVGERVTVLIKAQAIHLVPHR